MKSFPVRFFPLCWGLLCSFCVTSSCYCLGRSKSLLCSQCLRGPRMLNREKQKVTFGAEFRWELQEGNLEIRCKRGHPKLHRRGPALWHSTESCHLRSWHLIRVLVYVLAISLPIHIPADGQGSSRGWLEPLDFCYPNDRPR